MSKLQLCILWILWSVGVNSKIKFGEVETIFKLNDTFPSINETENVIRTIKQDMTQPGRFYFATDTALFTVDGLFDETSTWAELLVGDIEENGYNEGIGSESRFNGIFGMVQIEQPKGIIVTDCWNHCLRLIEQSSTDAGKPEWRTSTYAGKGDIPGSINRGRRTISEFYKPQGLLKLNNYLFIADYGNKRIQRLDMDDDNVITVHESQNFGPKQMTFGSLDNEIFVSANNGVLRVRDGKETWVVGSEHGRSQRKTTQFSSATFAQPAGLVQIDDVILVADGRSHSIKIVDLYRQEVQAMGKGWGTKDGSIDECSFRHPKTLTITDKFVVIGEAARIRILPYEVHNESASDDQSPIIFNCDKPPSIPNAAFESRESYPAGSEVYYQCIESYTSPVIASYLTCTKTSNSLLWTGQEIQCELSNTVVIAIALGGVCVVCLVTALALGLKQWRKNRELIPDVNGNATPVSRIGQQTTQPSFISRSLPTIENSQDYYESISEPPYIDLIAGNDDTSASGGYHDVWDYSVKPEYATTKM